jgi:HlyD family secretion protein
MKRHRKLIISVLVLAILAVSGYFYYTQRIQAAQVEAAPAVQTARVRSGDIQITASGVGNLTPAAEIRLGFRNAGVISELNVGVGDVVKAGQVLARLDDTNARSQLAQAELNLLSLTSPYAIAEAEKDLADAQEALNDALYARQAQQSGYRASASDIDAVKAELIMAEERVAKAWDKYAPLSGRPEDNLQRAVALAAYSKAVEARDATQRRLNWYLGSPSENDAAVLNADVAIAEARLAGAKTLLAELKGKAGSQAGPEYVDRELVTLRQARLALEKARIDLDNTTLVAPIDGTITAIEAELGETVNTNPILTIADLDHSLIRFYVEEIDLGKVATGLPVTVVFDANPDMIFNGEIVRVDPALVTVDGSPAVQAYAQLDPYEHDIRLLSGMSAEVEIVSGRSENTLLVPVQALREAAPGSYTVFVVQADGTLKLTAVKVGLKDFANAEILSGLKAGDQVSTGTVETK